MSRLHLSRRGFGLGLFGAALATLAAKSGSTKKRFVFVHAVGGWDPLVAFAPMFQSSTIQMAPDDEPVSVGDFRLVDGPGRPAVLDFFNAHGDRTLLLNGLSTRSVNHLAALAMALTGSIGDNGTDWATLLALDEADAYLLPHLALNATVYPGTHSVIVGRAEGWLSAAVDGSVVELSDAPVAPADLGAGALVDGYLKTESAAFAKAQPDIVLAGDLDEALRRSRGLTGAQDSVKLAPAGDLAGRVENAVRLLQGGTARCVSLATHDRPVWDTHDTNENQRFLFEELFSGLSLLMSRLASETGSDGAPLSADTVVVVLSEMARTPVFNEQAGRDHWPFTSALVIGDGITGGRTVGGYDAGYRGIGVKADSGDADPKRKGIDPKQLGATLLALGGADPSDYLEASPILGVLQ
jgi:uncharacterized protein (DUF1501 family)